MRKQIPRRLVWLSFVLLVSAAQPLWAQRHVPEYEQPPINYLRATPHDAVSDLLKRLKMGEARFNGTDPEIVRAVLRELKIPVESQLLVFSKTSAQRGLITPKNPRALYFSDSVYVGWVPGGLIEVSAVDPELGPIFYAFDPQDARDARRTFVRETSCLRCHANSAGNDIPALFTRSLLVSNRGELLEPEDLDVVEPEMPFSQRWGGWYVTGYTGKPNHRGNAFAVTHDEKAEFKSNDARPSELSVFLDTATYLEATSDVRALLVFQHQLDMHNCLTRASYQARRLLDSHKEPTEIARNQDVTLAKIADEVVDRLLFRQETPLPDGTNGGEAYRKAFANTARRDGAGDSLKDFAPNEHLFANRCSFLIYSDSFSALPALLKKQIFEKLHAVLVSDVGGDRYSYLGADEKRRILEILTQTLPEAQKQFALAQNQVVK